MYRISAQTSRLGDLDASAIGESSPLVIPRVVASAPAYKGTDASVIGESSPLVITRVSLHQRQHIRGPKRNVSTHFSHFIFLSSYLHFSCALLRSTDLLRASTTIVAAGSWDRSKGIEGTLSPFVMQGINISRN
jgi:hypothetical protein